MTGRSPPPIPRIWVLVGGLVYFVFLAYTVLILNDLLIGLLPLVVFVFVYLGWRFLVAFETIADALSRIADQREEE